MNKFRDFDRITMGMQKTDLIIIAARPSMGKTAFITQLACNIVKNNSVAIFSREMSGEQLEFRMKLKKTENTGQNTVKKQKN